MSSTSTSIRRSSMVELRAPDFLDWIVKGGVDPNLLELLHICSEDAPHTATPASGSEQSGDVDPDAFDNMGLQYSPQTTLTPASDAFDVMDLQYPPHASPAIRSPSPCVHDSLLDSRNDSDDSDDGDSDAVDEVVPYVPFKASPSAFLSEAPFRFASEEHFPVPSPAPSFDSHNALQLDLGLQTPAFAQSASVTVQQIITPASPRPSRTRTNDIALLEAALHSEDAVPDSDDDAGDEEYVPPTRNTTRKRRRVARSSSYASHVPTKRPRPALPPRNIQLPLLPDSPLDCPADTLSLFISEGNPWLCVCGWEQKNHRMPDLKRHIRTHTQDFEPARWVCCGVPLAQAPAGVSTLHPVVHNGELRVGGCMAKFSRRDALRRHLQNENIHCIGEVVEQPLYTL